MTTMEERKTDILVIGCGAAGMAVAAAASDAGVRVTVVDDRLYPGGILPQCVHSGFGLGKYGREMSGPEYCEEELRHFRSSGAGYLPGTRVLKILPGRRAVISGPGGISAVSFEECVIAAGCTEKSIWSLPVSGTRPEGVYTAGEAQELTELGGCDIGSRIFIVGSGDIGQIMARRLTQLGKKVLGMAEITDRLGGMKRNQEQCIRAYNIPVILESTVTEIHGYPRLEGITLHHYDTDTDSYIECDALISALGLEPDRTLAEDLLNDGSYPHWLHFCGNADYVHEIADSVSSQGESLGKSIAGKIRGKRL